MADSGADVRIKSVGGVEGELINTLHQHRSEQPLQFRCGELEALDIGVIGTVDHLQQ